MDFIELQCYFLSFIQLSFYFNEMFDSSDRNCVHIDRPVVTDGDKSVAGVIQLDSPDLVLVLFEGVDTLPGVDLPDLDTAVTAARHQVLVIRGEAHRDDPGDVAGHAAQQGGVADVVQLHVAVIGPCQQLAAVGTEAKGP